MFEYGVSPCGHPGWIRFRALTNLIVDAAAFGHLNVLPKGGCSKSTEQKEPFLKETLEALKTALKTAEGYKAGLIDCFSSAAWESSPHSLGVICWVLSKYGYCTGLKEIPTKGGLSFCSPTEQRNVEFKHSMETCFTWRGFYICQTP